MWILIFILHGDPLQEDHVAQELTFTTGAACRAGEKLIKERWPEAKTECLSYLDQLERRDD